MASLTIRKLDDEVKRRLRLRAAEHGVSVEEEARQILALSVTPPSRDGRHWVDIVTALVDEVGGADLEIPPRDDSLHPATFD